MNHLFHSVIRGAIAVGRLLAASEKSSVYTLAAFKPLLMTTFI